MKIITAVLTGLLCLGCIKVPTKVGTCEKLPDLVIVDVYVTTDLPYLFIKYANIGEADVKDRFAFKVKINSEEFMTPDVFPQKGETLRAGEERTSGGVGFLMFGLDRGQTGDVSVCIDYNLKVKESDETNNIFYKTQLFKKK
jgi:hypothetical protein